MGILTLVAAIMMASMAVACPNHLKKTHRSPGCNRPHIIYILADDLGWGDVGWHDREMHTPNLDRIKQKGVELTNYYTQPACTASRVALFTGRYPYKMGLQRNDMAQFHRWRNHSLSTDITILPEYLKKYGYANHLVGKWQMGFCNWDYTPTRRGFESFYGSYGGNSGHYNHTPKVGGYDFRDNLNVDWSANGSYSTTLYTDRAIKIMREHSDSNDTRPLFLFVSYEAPHVPIESPECYITDHHCGNIEGKERQNRCGMVAALDEGVGKIEAELEKLGYMENALIIFSSDNGAPGQGAGSNWPLRGKKRGIYEGGIRVPSFMYSKSLLPKSPYMYTGLMHITDWLPTLLQVAHIDSDQVLSGEVDGLDLWDRIRRNETSRRNKVVLDIDAQEQYGAVRIGNWKLVKDKGDNGKCWGWFNVPKNMLESFARKKKCSAFRMFNLAEDPYERNHKPKKVFPRMFEKLRAFMERSFKMAGELPHVVNITDSYPENWNGVWSPGWCDRAHWY